TGSKCSRVGPAVTRQRIGLAFMPERITLRCRGAKPKAKTPGTSPGNPLSEPRVQALAPDYHALEWVEVVRHQSRAESGCCAVLPVFLRRAGFCSQSPRQFFLDPWAGEHTCQGRYRVARS